MSKKESKKWSLDSQEVSWGMNGSSSGKPGQFERKLKTTSSSVFLTHVPTGVKVEGEVPSGSYCQKWCSGAESSGDLIDVSYLDSVFEFHASYHLGQVIEST